MTRSIAAIATWATLLPAAILGFSPAEARDPNSFKQIHYFSPPILLLPQLELRICTAHIEKPASRRQSLAVREDMIAELKAYDLERTPLIEPRSRALNVEGLGVCFDVSASELGIPGGAPAEAVLIEVVISAFASSRDFALVSMELRDCVSDTTHTLLLPAAQAAAPDPNSISLAGSG
jgi:hypothetical protein